MLRSPLRSAMRRDRSNCGRLNADGHAQCTLCGTHCEVSRAAVYRRITVCIAACIAVLCGFYFSLIISSKPLTASQHEEVQRAIAVLRERGFADEVFMLEHFAAFRSTDNWLNASVAKENAYAATNFPFELITLYPDFFTYPADDTERAAILLHEARHLAHDDESEAYTFVWRNREKLGWTKEKYSRSPVWLNVRKQTKDTVPELFTCREFNFGDCTEAELQ